MVETRERVLPSNTVNRVVRERAEKLAEQQGHAVNKKHMAQIKDDVISILLPKSHIKTTQNWVVIANDYLIVGTASPKHCDEITALLGDACRATWKDPSFKLEKLDPRGASTRWLTALAINSTDAETDEDDLSHFNTRDSATLYSSGKHGGVIKVKDIDMSNDAVQEKLAEGWLVKDMAVMYRSSLLFTLTHSCIFKGFKFSDVVLSEKMDDENDNSLESRLDSALALFSGEVARMLNQLADEFEVIFPSTDDDHSGLDGDEDVDNEFMTGDDEL